MSLSFKTLLLLIGLIHNAKTVQDLKDNCANLAGSWTGEYKYAISGFIRQSNPNHNVQSNH